MRWLVALALTPAVVAACFPGADAAPPDVPASHPERDGPPLPEDAVARVGLGGRLRFDDAGRTLQLWDGGVVAVDWRSGQTVRRASVPHEGMSSYMAVSRDLSRVAGINAGRKVTIWDTASGKQVCELPTESKAWSKAVFSPDGKTLYTGEYNGPVRAWNAATGKELPAFNKGQRIVQSLVVSPDGQWLAAAEQPQATAVERELTVWDLAAGRELRRLLPPKEGRTAALAFDAHGTRLAAVGSRPRPAGRESGFIAVWDVRTGEERIADTNLTAGVTAVAFSDDGRTLVTGSADGGVRLWELASGELRYHFAGHKKEVLDVACSPDGKFVASSGSDAPVFVWDVEGCHGKPPATTLLTARRVAGLWSMLGDDSAAGAFVAMRTLLANPEPAVALLRKRLRPTPFLDVKVAAQLLHDLDADAFAVREKAAADLEALGENAEPLLRKALQEKPSAEVKRRIDRILESPDFAAPRRLRTVRAVEVLERIGSADARKLLENLAAGADAALMTREARAAVERLKGR
jgi:sugar lactone lactonase YvrE